MIHRSGEIHISAQNEFPARTDVIWGNAEFWCSFLDPLQMGGGGGGYQCHGNNWTSTVYILAENPDFSYIESRLMQKDPPESVGVSATHVSNMTAASNIYGQYPENRYQ